MHPEFQIRRLHRDWRHSLSELVAHAREELVVVAPYMTAEGLRLVRESMSSELRLEGRLDLATDLSPRHVCDGSLDVDALLSLQSAHDRAGLWHVPGLHAKLYLADSRRAIVTSGNLTSGAFHRNLEYGVLIDDRELVSDIRRDVADIQALGARISTESLRDYSDTARRVRETYQRRTEAADPRLERALRDAIGDAESELIRFRLAGGALHTVFARTILLILERHGPLATPEIHEMVRQLHPDLCDDSVDRVIDGKRFGKKWKHAVRTSQWNLKQRGQIRYDGRVWSLAEKPESTR